MNEDEEGLIEWFQSAAKAASETPAARAIAGRVRSQTAKELREIERRRRDGQIILDRAKAAKEAARALPPRPEESAIAKSVFDAVASGRISSLGAGVPAPWEKLPVGGSGSAMSTPYSKPPVFSRGGVLISDVPLPKTAYTPNTALAVILDHVDKTSDEDVMRVASEWLTKVTNGITDILKSRELD